MKTMLVTMCLAAAMSAIACGGGDDSPNEPAKTAPAQKVGDNQTPAPAPSSSSTSTGSDVPAPAPSASSTATDDTPPPPPPAKPDAPTIETIHAQQAGIKLTWDQETCDSFVGERKYGLVPYTQVFEVPGSTLEFLDATVDDVPNNATTEFTYRIRCKKDGVFSDYSDEQSSTGFQAESIQPADPNPIKVTPIPIGP